MSGNGTGRPGNRAEAETDEWRTRAIPRRKRPIRQSAAPALSGQALAAHSAASHGAECRRREQHDDRNRDTEIQQRRLIFRHVNTSGPCNLGPRVPGDERTKHECGTRHQQTRAGLPTARRGGRGRSAPSGEPAARRPRGSRTRVPTRNTPSSTPHTRP